MEPRNLSLDILRIVACLGVIMIHTSGSPIVHGLVETGTVGYYECLLLEALSRWSVPVFAMITGYFMLDSQKELPIKVLFSKYILRLTVALIFWSLFYAATLHAPYYPFGIQEGHFWYLGMCIGLYLAMPVMRLITQNKRILKYFCYTWFGIMVYKFAGNFVDLPIDLRDVMFVDFVGYCLWANYLKTTDFSASTYKAIYVFGMLGLAITIAAGIITQDADTAWYGYTSPNVIAVAMALFVFCITHTLNAPKYISRIISNCSQCTFGIYLVHLWILVQIFFRVHRYIPDTLSLCLICVSVAFIVGWGVTALIKKIPILNKYIV